MNQELTFIHFNSPTGKERNPCEICKQSFKKEDDTFSVIKSSFKGHSSYGLTHSKCFLKLLLTKYNFDIDEMKKEIVIDKLK